MTGRKDRAVTVFGLFLSQLEVKTGILGQNRESCGSFGEKSDTATAKHNEQEEGHIGFW